MGVASAALAVVLAAMAMLLSGCTFRPGKLERAIVESTRSSTCPVGYRPHKGHFQHGGHVSFAQTLAVCGAACDSHKDCLSFEYSPIEKWCVHSKRAHPSLSVRKGYHFCEKILNDCPSGYISHEGHLEDGGRLSSKESIGECARACESDDDCGSFEYSTSEMWCVLNSKSRPNFWKHKDYHFCEKSEKPGGPARQKELGRPERPVGHEAHFDAGFLQPGEYVDQPHAEIPVGGTVKLYAVGSSNILWMTWIDQLHLNLKRLGYKLPAVPAKTEARFYPSEPQTCDDTKYFNDLRTARMGKIGWHSWDFAYDGWDDCGHDGYRNITGEKVKCAHGPGCAFGRDVVRLSDIAEDASQSDVTLVTTWFNDDQPDAIRCFNGTSLPREKILEMSIDGLRRLVRAIHAKNPNVWILILAKYSVFHHVVDQWFTTLNANVKASLEKEPKTLFIDYNTPPPGGWPYFSLWQTAHPNHPNCRGSKLMAHAIMERLYEAKVLARSVSLVNPEVNKANRNCTSLEGAACRTSAFCWVEPKERQCKTYSAGSEHFIERTG
mmetsp:Transcript_114970/g.245507  ORF Transcript_114970/g.245507 Transcript_114970/m.245507 type:complete len:550 (+) Transcript_114970:51-1700(+)